MFTKSYKDSLAVKTVSFISVAVLVVGILPTVISAAQGGNGNGNTNTTSVCHQLGNGSWEVLTPANEGQLNGHLEHGDFLVDDNNPCPPDEEEEETDVCPDIDGIQEEGTNCEEEACDQAEMNWVEDNCLTDEEYCEQVDGGFWNGEGCDDIASCDEDEILNEYTNECEDVEEDTCPEGYVGTYPDCEEDDQCEVDCENECTEDCDTSCDEGQVYNEQTEACEDENTTPTCDEGQILNEETNECEDTDTTPTCNDNQHLENNECVNNEDTEESSDEPTTTGGGSYGGGSYVAPQGQVLGASTSAGSCSVLLTKYLRINRANDAEEVKKLQNFLNGELGLSLDVNGIFGADTHEAVNAFQLKYENEVLTPWGPFGLPAGTPTGYVFKTTQRWINMVHCASLNLPMPELN